jgi:hypothetical protein
MQKRSTHTQQQGRSMNPSSKIFAPAPQLENFNFPPLRQPTKFTPAWTANNSSHVTNDRAAPAVSSTEALFSTGELIQIVIEITENLQTTKSKSEQLTMLMKLISKHLIGSP